MPATGIQITAVDGIINVNSILALAVFIGLAWNSSLIDQPQPTRCPPSRKVAGNLVAFHVCSVTCFFFSSLVALGLKRAIRLARRENRAFLAGVNRTAALRAWYMVAAVGSVCGSIFLMLATVDVAHIKVGVVGRGGVVVPLFIFVPAGLLIYIRSQLYAFPR